MLSSRDPVVRYSSSLEIKKEAALQRATHRPMLTASDALAEDPGMSKRALMKKAKSIVCNNDKEKRLNHALSLQCQGRTFRCCKGTAASIWSAVVQNIPSHLLKFSLNSVQDTLPHNDNLARWKSREGLSRACKLCEGRQTPLHVLNSCPKALSLRRYNERHDNVLEVLANFFGNTLPEGFSDIPKYQPYIFPPT